ncbi:hypothetical protein BASA62_007970 [Batrachochytrium salamandrivorans]|nr:hypothetical protein BASA62_007970 [Batrachochytrium salamandrivorans]
MIPALVLVSSDQTAIQKQILADTTGQTKDSQATTLVCIDGDSTNMRRLGIAPKYEYLGVIIDDLLTLSPWLVKKKRAITAAAHSISPLLRNNFLSTRYRLTIFNGLVLGVAYYGLELIGGNSTLARRLQAPNHYYIHYYPLYPNHLRDPTPALQVCIRAYIPSLGQVQIGLQLCAGKPRVKCKFLRSPALSTGQAIGASLLSLARCGGLWDYPRALKAGLLHPYSNRPRPAGQSQSVYTLPLSLGLQAHGPLGDTRFEPPISVAHSEIPRQAQDTVEENPTGSRTTTTDTHTAAISSTPTPTHISYIGSDDIFDSAPWGGAFLALTLPGILKHVLVSNG